MTHLKYGKLNFIISGSPNPNNINDFISTIQKYKVTDIVRACDLDYDECKFKSLCNIHECVLEDGKYPSDEIIHKWVNLLFNYFYQNKSNDSYDSPILIYCRSGLGRSPILACLAIIICENIEPYNAIPMIRNYIQYAFNNIQLNYLLKTNWKIYRNEFKKLLKQNRWNGSNCAIC